MSTIWSRQSLAYFVRSLNHSLSVLAESEGHLYLSIIVSSGTSHRLCIHASLPSYGYSLQGVTGITELTVQLRGNIILLVSHIRVTHESHVIEVLFTCECSGC